MKAKTILEDFRGGSSMPVHVEASDCAQYVVKWKCTGEGPLANAVDWVCLQLAREFGILVPTPSLIIIEPDLASQTNHGELRDLIMRSLGVNLGIEYIEHAVPYSVRHLEEIKQIDKELIFLFDVLFLNIDRTDDNSNMIASGNRLYCIDFAAAMSLKMLMNGQEYSEQTLLPLIRRHPFYTNSADVSILDSVVSAERVTEIVESIPDEWTGGSATIKQKLSSGITQILNDCSAVLERRISILNNLPLESAEERKARTLRNRKTFEENWGKL